jgi:hypothetical protein
VVRETEFGEIRGCHHVEEAYGGKVEELQRVDEKAADS